MKGEYTAQEIAAALKAGLRQTQRRARAESWPYVGRQVKGGTKHHYIYDSLPEAVKAAVRSHELAAASEDLPAYTYNDSDSPLFPALARAEVDWDARRRDQALGRLAAVEKARQLGRNLAGKKKLAKAQDVSYHTLQRWIRTADEALALAEAQAQDPITAQLTALVPQHGKSKGRTRAFDEPAIQWAMKRYLNQSRLTIADIYEDLIVESQIQGWQVGSATTLNRIIKQRIDPGPLLLARQGQHKFEAQAVVKKLRRYDDIPPLFCLVGDHHIFDIFVHVPGSTPKRAWLTAWLDLRTRAFVGWNINFQPNSRTIALALRHAILPKGHPDLPYHGLPTSVYIDNGKDYRAQALKGEVIDLGNVDYPDWMDKFAALGIDPAYVDMKYDPTDQVWKAKRGRREHIVKGVRVGGMFARLAIRARYATAYHPWAKHIERAFGEVVRSFSRRMPGWCGSNPKERPEKLAFELKNSAANLLTIDQLEIAWIDHLTNRYHNRPHSGHGMNGLSPRQAWDSLARPQSCDPALLDFALMSHREVTVRSFGFRLPQLGEYELWHRDQRELAGILNQLHGKKLQILYDPSRPAIVRCYHNGRFAAYARTLQRTSYVTDDGLAEHARLQSLQRRQAAAALAALGAEPARALADPTIERLALVDSLKTDPQTPARLDAPPDAPTPRPTPAAEDAPSPAGSAPDHGDRPEIFGTALDRAKWIIRATAAGRPVPEEDKVWLSGYMAGNPDLAPALQAEAEYLAQAAS